MKNISQAKLRRVSVPLPRLDLQIAFAEKIYSIEAIVRHLDAAAAKAEAVTAALAAEVFDRPPHAGSAEQQQAAE
jgi:hypothetical protein